MMSQYFRVVFLLLFLFGLVSCVHISAEAKKVRLTSNKNLVENCQFINGFFVDPSFGLENKIKRKTFKVGGDIALISFVGEVWSTFEAYRCSEQSPQMEENVQTEANAEEAL